VLVQAYSFTSKPIAEALVRAHQRGVKISVILDKSQRTEKYTEADFIANYGIPTYIDDKHAIAHSKTIITGSFNFTTSAELHNAENLLIIRDSLLIIRDSDLALTYMRNWEVHFKHSDPYAGRGTR
jgi:phosphatidylserine/phosphatidylglycerophosphate/cardiolipin synthase-like enzyme